MKLFWIAASAFLSTAAAAPMTGPCLIDLPGAPFEERMGYELSTARDGTVFTATEHQAFDQLAAVLPPLFRNMTTLGRFERVPDGFVLAGGAVGEYTARGWRALGRQKIRGEIYIAQREIKTGEGRLTGDFYFTVLHEMAHALDFQEVGYAQSDEWTSLSTWDAEGRGTSKNFVSWYAPSSPDEDFAESMAYFVLDPDTLLAAAPTKFDTLSRRFFGGRRFDSNSMLRDYEAQLRGLQPAARAQKVRELWRTDYYACKLLK